MQHQLTMPQSQWNQNQLATKHQNQWLLTMHQNQWHTMIPSQ